MSDTAPQFSDAEIPADAPAESLDPVCGYPGCETPLVYSGRGRKPKFCDDHKRTGAKSARASTGSPADVKAAMSSLGMIYDGLATGLVIVGAPRAAAEWAGNIETLQARNADVLANDKALCKAINRFGQTSARGTFIFAHLMALGPVVMIAQSELGMKRPPKPSPVPDTAEAFMDAAELIDFQARQGQRSTPDAPLNPKIQF